MSTVEPPSRAVASVAITGATGLIGRALVRLLASSGRRAIRIVRRDPQPGDILWDPARGLDPRQLGGVDAVVHLAGESIAGSRWSKAQRDRIMASRVAGTKAVVDAVLAADAGPRILVCASAVGYYGDRGDVLVDEDSRRGEGFLPDVVTAWEEAAAPARSAGARVAHSRLGVVLSPAGGMLGRILPIFRLGLGGRLGTGRQWFSWVAIDDCVRALAHLLYTEVEGPFNVTSPFQVTNAELTTTLGRVLHRPTLLPVPAFVLRLAFGGLADEGLLASTRVAPTRLIRSGFEFRFPTLQGALEHLLGRSAR